MNNTTYGTNIIYLTTNCNLDCDYCYEKDNRNKLKKQKELTELDIDNFLLEINNREKNRSSVVVIFGGEPFLKYDLIKYLIKKGKEIKNFSYCLTTNGILLSKEKIILDFIKFYYNEIYNKNVSLSIEISYDVSGNYRRYDKNGKTYDKEILLAMRYLSLAKIPFALRYTITKSNFNNFYNDLELMINKFKIISKVQTAIVFSEFDENISQIFKNDAIKLFQRYNIPICDFVCEICKKCDKSNSNNYYYLKNKKLVVEKDKQKEFDHFINIKE